MPCCAGSVVTLFAASCSKASTKLCRMCWGQTVGGNGVWLCAPHSLQSIHPKLCMMHSHTPFIPPICLLPLPTAPPLPPLLLRLPHALGLGMSWAGLALDGGLAAALPLAR